MASMDLFTIVGIISAVVIAAVIIALCKFNEGCSHNPGC